jgi:integrase
MKNKPRRKRIGKGIYRDAYGISATVKVGSGRDALQREKRYPFDTAFKEMREWQDKMRADLRKQAGRPASTARKGTLAADATRFLKMMKGRASYKSLRSEMQAWTTIYGRLRRSHLTAEHVKIARGQWQEAGFSPKTCNNRLQALRQLYHGLDGDEAPTPIDKVKPLKVRPSVKHNVAADTFRTVAVNLAADPKTRARFMVIACTGCRPSELKPHSAVMWT